MYTTTRGFHSLHSLTSLWWWESSFSGVSQYEGLGLWTFSWWRLALWSRVLNWEIQGFVFRVVGYYWWFLVTFWVVCYLSMYVGIVRRRRWRSQRDLGFSTSWVWVFSFVGLGLAMVVSTFDATCDDGRRFMRSRGGYRCRWTFWAGLAFGPGFNCNP